MCTLACADQPEDFGIPALTATESMELADHFGDNLHADTLREVAVRMVLYGHPLESEIMDALDREAAVRRVNGEDAQVADPNRHPAALKRLAEARTKWGVMMIDDSALESEDLDQLQAACDAASAQGDADSPQYRPPLQQFVDRVLARHGNRELVEGFWENANGTDDRRGDDYVPLSKRSYFEHKLSLHMFHTLQSSLKLRTFVQPKVFTALTKHKGPCVKLLQHLTEQESVVGAREREYYERNPADKRVPQQPALEAVKKVAALLGLGGRLQPCDLSQELSYLLPSKQFRGDYLAKLEERVQDKRAELVAQGRTETEVDDPASEVQEVRQHQALVCRVTSLKALDELQLPELRLVLQKALSAEGHRRDSSPNLQAMLNQFLKTLGMKLVPTSSFEIETGTIHDGRGRAGAGGTSGSLPKQLAIKFNSGKTNTTLICSMVPLVASSKCPLCLELVRACDWCQHKELIHEGEIVPEPLATAQHTPAARRGQHTEVIDYQGLAQYLALYIQAIPPYWHVPAEGAVGLSREQMVQTVAIMRELLAEARMHPKQELITFYSDSCTPDGPRLCSHSPSTGHHTFSRLQCLSSNFLRAAAHPNYHRVLFLKHWRGAMFKDLLQRLLRASQGDDDLPQLPTEEDAAVRAVVADDPVWVDTLLLQQSASAAAPMGATTKEMVEKAMSELLHWRCRTAIEEMYTFNSVTRLTTNPRPALRTHYDVLEGVFQEQLKDVLLQMQSKLLAHGFIDKWRTVFLLSPRKRAFNRPGLLVQKADGGDFAGFVAACQADIWQAITNAPLTPPAPPYLRHFGRNPNRPPAHTQLYYDLGLLPRTTGEAPTKEQIKEAYFQSLTAYAKREGLMAGLSEEQLQEKKATIEKAYDVLVDTEGLCRVYDEGGIAAVTPHLRQLPQGVQGNKGECAICMEGVTAPDEAAMHGPCADLGAVCSHTNMHFACVAAASQLSKTCPMCRAAFTQIRHRGEFFAVATDAQSMQLAGEAQQEEANRGLGIRYGKCII